MAPNSFNNNQHVKISLITLKVSAVCTVQQCSNVAKFHEAKLRPVSEKKLYTIKRIKNALEFQHFKLSPTF